MWLTEQRNPRTEEIDRLTTLEMLSVMSDEDGRVASIVREALPDIAQAVDAVTGALEQGGRLIYVGAGTSGRLGVLDAVECVPTFSLPADRVIGLLAGGVEAMTSSIEGVEDSTELGRADLMALSPSPRDVVCGIAASGRTPYVLAAIRAGNTAGSVTIGISCNQPAPLLDLAQIKIALPVGPEVIAGSTRLKAGTAQKMALNMISTGSMIRLGKVYGNQMIDVKVSNQKLAERARRIVEEIADVDQAQAEILLREASNEVKTAVVMSRRSVSADEARRLLAEAGGRLRDVVG